MFIDLQSILPKTIKNAGIENRLKNDKIIEIIQDEIDRVMPQSQEGMIKAMYVKGGVVTVACLSDDAKCVLREKEEDVREVMTVFFGEEVVKKIRYIS